MNKIVLLFVPILIGVGCSSYTPTNGCPSESDLVCGDVCCDPAHYTCGHNTCILISCDNGYEMCHGRCVPFPSDCCADGSFCYGQLCGSNHSCLPVGSTDCGNGRYCPFGHGCLNGGSSCTP